jgi:hypothetical protein
VPREHWPEYPCHEHDGKGWEVTVTKRKRDWALCRFVHAKDDQGQPYPSEWRKMKDLIQLQPAEATADLEQPVGLPDATPQPTAAPVPPMQTPAGKAPAASPGTAKGPKRREADLSGPSQLEFDQPVPNMHTQPASDGDDPLREPVRPERVRRQPDRLEYASLALAAVHDECAALGFEMQSPRWPEAAFLVAVDDGADRLVAEAHDLCTVRGTVMALADVHHIEHEYTNSPPELQRACMIAADSAKAADEYGVTSPQVKFTRELYAVAALDAAQHGVHVPPFDPLIEVVVGHGQGDLIHLRECFDDVYSGCLLQSSDPTLGSELFALSKAKTAPDIFSERQMNGPEWDEPKSKEIAKIIRLGAKTDVCADDPSIKGMQVCEMVWAGRRKRHPDGTWKSDNARCCARGDLDKLKTNLTANDKTAPVARNSTNLCFDAVACLRAQHKKDYDVPGAYLQGEQYEHERRVYRPPRGFRTFDERGIEVLWLSNSPFYGQTDAGAIWNRTINNTLTSDREPDGCGLERCSQDPSLYTTNVSDGELGGQVNNTLYVDDGRIGWDPAPAATSKEREIEKKLGDRYGIVFHEDDPAETHFLGANILTAPSRQVASVRATSYIDLQVKRYADGDVSVSKRFPAHWSHLPADETLVRAWEAAMATREPATPELTKAYQSLYGSLLHAVKFRPEIAAALQLCGACLTFPTPELYECLMHVLVYLGRTRKLGTTFSAHMPDAGKLRAYADSNWSISRSVSGFLIMLAGAAIVAVSRRQHCITMSSCEAELVALADLAIELLHIIEVVKFLGHDVEEPVEAHTDSKAAYDLCHRFTSAQNSRHIDRKLFKMRELRGAGRVTVKHIPGETNPADLFTKILTRQPFEKHRKVTLNIPGDTGMEYARRTSIAARSAISLRDGTAAP